MKKKITDELIQKASELASKGFSHKQIMEAVGIGKTAFYKNANLMVAIKSSQDDLRGRVADALLQKACDLGDATSLIFLSKRLNLFSSDVNIDLSTPKDALKALEQLANSNLSLEHLNALRGIVSDYTKLYEVTELEERLAKLEQAQN
jgi:lysozyme family protein